MIHELAEKIKEIGQSVQDLRIMLKDYCKTYNIRTPESLDSMNTVELIRFSQLIVSIAKSVGEIV